MDDPDDFPFFDEEPSRPSVDADPFDVSVDYVAETFGATTGHLAQAFPGYAPRVGQVEMAYAVLEAMESGHNLLVEAGTGTGKSQAYCMPASMAAARGERVVIVTANIALQEQLIRKDLPLLAKAVPWEFTFAIAKGLNNYLCRAALSESIDEVLMKPGQLDARSQSQWTHVTRWAEQTDTGDLSELPFEPTNDVRYRFTIMSDECIGRKCPHYQNCPAIAARQAAASASIVVTNYALFYADLVMKRSGARGVLPAYTHVVLDEGHRAGELARGFIGWRLTRGSINHAARLLDNKATERSRKGPLPVIDPALKQQLLAASDDLFGALTTHFHSKEFNVRFRRPWTGPIQVHATAVSRLLMDTAEAYRGVNKDLLTPERVHELKVAADRAATIASNLQACSDHAREDWVYSMREEFDRIVLEASPIYVDEYLRENLFEHKEGPNAIKSVTVTSATMCTAVGDFGFIAKELGVKNAEELVVESPFDVPKNMMVLLPAMPDPNSPRFTERLGERLLEIVTMAKGRTLGLFTSYRNLNAAYDFLARQGVPYKLLKHGAAPRMQLIEQFKADVHSVLFGTESFWAGVDVPGESLSVVVIDKLPFPNIGDPLEDVLKEKLGKDYFFQRSIPLAVIAVRQGVGRLLRTVTDRGVVVLLDSRISEKGYGRTFTKSFPPGTPMFRDLGRLADFLDKPAV